jgi:hypothetical protein
MFPEAAGPKKLLRLLRKYNGGVFPISCSSNAARMTVGTHPVTLIADNYSVELSPLFIVSQNMIKLRSS